MEKPTVQGIDVDGDLFEFRRLPDGRLFVLCESGDSVADVTLDPNTALAVADLMRPNARAIEQAARALSNAVGPGGLDVAMGAGHARAAAVMDSLDALRVALARGT
jgi:hypothetical protein